MLQLAVLQLCYKCLKKKRDDLQISVIKKCRENEEEGKKMENNIKQLLSV
jgi:vacuolar-type H+-ATPase subunit D/Vma8